MKKLFAISMVLILALTMFVGCNKQILDTTYKFDKAIVSLPDGTVVSGKVDGWKDFEDGDQIQVKINGVTYLVHSSNIVLIKE